MMSSSFYSHDDLEERTVLDKVQRMQDSLISRAVGGEFVGGDETYQRLRLELMGNPALQGKLPDFLKRCRSIDQFWQFIKHKFPSYKERRTFLYDSFNPALESLELEQRNPGSSVIAASLEAYDPEGVHTIWQKALDRITSDPGGAITAARTLLETTCKYILDDTGIDYGRDTDLPKLWAMCAETLNLAPHQHDEQIFRAILGNSQAVVNGLATIRNRIGDAHGQGRAQRKPKPRHAELAVNLAGTMASFLISTWKEKKDPQ